MLNNLQIQQLERLIDYYFRDENFIAIHEHDCEGYKWRAVQIFRDTDRKKKNEICSAMDKYFFVALKEALSEGNNLIHFRNQNTLFRLARLHESETRELFYKLEQENNRSLDVRLKEFTDECEQLISSDKLQKLSASDAMTILALLRPDEYYIYRPFVMDRIYAFLNSGFKYPYRSAIKKACDFHELCNDMLEYMNENKPDLIEKYKKMIKKNKNLYQDENCHLLVQNIIYSLYYAGENLKNPVKKTSDYRVVKQKNMVCPIFEESNISQKSKPRKFDLEKEYQKEKNNIKNGELGETIIFEELRRQYGSNVEYISKKDDSKHYDILVKLDTRKIYVEVKTVSYSRSRSPKSRIYITQAEVKFSQKNKENYELYIVYLDKKNKKCDYQVFQGDVTEGELKLDYSKNGDRYVLELKTLE